MSAPPVPPRPYEVSTNEYLRSQGNNNSNNGPPPLPPLPPDLRIQAEKYVTPSRYEFESPPHFQTPLIAPRPTRVDKSIPVNMARTLDEQMKAQQLQLQQQQQQQQQQPQGINYTPGFAPQYTQGAGWQSAPITQADLATSIANLNLFPTSFPPPPTQQRPPPPQAMTVAPPLQPQLQPQQRQQIPNTIPPPISQQQPQPPPSTTTSSAPPSLTAPLPQISQLTAAAAQIQTPTHDPALKIAWARDIFYLLHRAQGNPPDPVVGPLTIADPALAHLASLAVPLVLQLAGSWAPSQGGKMPAHVAEAIYLRATLAATGAFPEYARHNPRTAFRDFESAARGGYAPAWFRLGRDYENFNDHTRAKDCFERGAKLGVESCLYRLGMAHLLGQLSLPANSTVALSYLHRAALLASLLTPQPAYVFALLLLAEFTQLPPLPPSLFTPYIPANSSPTLYARLHLERAAYLHFPAAQYKLGHAYEFAEPPFGFDPLLSVQYYSLASQQGEVEADMALSKWFLCGSGGAAAGVGGSSSSGAFEKDEALALTFAEKAARKGLPSAEFAMGYYAEVGVGQARDVQAAVVWYRKAESHGNTDATARLQALTSGPAPQSLSRQEHDTITEQKLVRRRTQAMVRAETQPLSPPWEGRIFPSAKEWEEGGGPVAVGVAGAQGQGQGQPQRTQNQQLQDQQEYAVQGRLNAQQQNTAPLQGGRRRPNADPRMVVDVIRKNSLATGYGRVSVGVAGGAGGAGGYNGVGGGQGQGILQEGVRGESPQRTGAGMRSDSPQRMGGRGRYDSSSGPGSGAMTPPQQQRTESPHRRTQSPVGARRNQSPGRLGRLPISSSPSSVAVNSSPSMTHQHSNSLSGSPGRVGGAGGMEGRSKLERMRLNLDDPPPSNPNAFPPSSASFPSSSNLNGNNSRYGGAGGSNTPLATAQGPLATPGAGLAGGATPTPSTARPGGGKAQTFADLGIQSGKAEEKDCVIM